MAAQVDRRALWMIGITRDAVQRGCAHVSAALERPGQACRKARDGEDRGTVQSGLREVSANTLRRIDEDAAHQACVELAVQIVEAEADRAVPLAERLIEPRFFETQRLDAGLDAGHALQ